MSSITAALRTAQSGLLVNQSALNSTANNITNVNTVGYSRQIVQFKQRVVSGVGAGVEIGAIIRSVDEGLLKSVRLELSQTATLSSQNTFYERIQDLFGEPEDNNSISHLVAEFAASLEALATTPENTLEMSDVVRRAEDIASRLKDMTETIQELRLQADRSISQGVDEINLLINNINQFNNDIVANSTSNRGTTDIRDQRDLALDRLSELMDIRFFLRSDGDVVIFTSSGRTLLDNLPTTLAHTPAATLSATSTHAEGDISGIYAGAKIAANDLTNDLREGTLHGLVTIRDSILTDLQSQLDEFAAELRDAVNQTHNRGMPFPGMTQMTGTRQFVDTATQTIKLDPANSSDDVTIALLDNSGDQSAITTLNTIMVAGGFSTRGSTDDWTIDDVAATIQTWIQANGAGTATVDVTSGKMVINLNSTTLNLNFRDQTESANGATAEDAVISFDANGDGAEDESITGFSNFFGLNDFFIDNRAINIHESNVLVSSFTVSAATLTFTDSTGTLAGSPLAVAAGTTLQALVTQINNNITNVTASIVPDGSGVRLRIAHDKGSDLIITQAGGDTLLDAEIGLHRADVGASGVLSLRSDISASPSFISRGILQWDANLGLAGQYHASIADDTVVTAIADIISGNNAFDTAGGLPTASINFSEYAANILATNATKANNNDSRLQSQQQILDSLKLKSDNLRGVNLDEELTNLILFEQAFSAAARIISVIQNMFDALERAVSR